ALDGLGGAFRHRRQIAFAAESGREETPGRYNQGGRGMIFALIAACATAAVLAVVLSPLLTEARPARIRARSDLAIYRGRLAEIERDAARGLVAPGDASAAHLEIERRILASGFAGDAP